MKVSTNQTGNAIDRGRWTIRIIIPAKAKPVTRSGFETRFCAVLIGLIFAIVAMVSVALTHLSATVVPPDLLRIAFSDFL